MSYDTWLGGGPDEVTSHDIEIDGSPADVWDALNTADFGRSPIVSILLFARGIGRRHVTLDSFVDREFALLERSERERLVLGMVGRPHRSQIDRVTAEEFSSYAVPNSVRIVWEFAIAARQPGRSHLSTRTMIRSTDEKGRRSFRRYWRLVKPFSGMLRRAMLRRVKREVERRG